MEKIIKSYLYNLGILTVLRSKIVRKVVNICFFDFIGIDGKFYSFSACFNETQVFEQRHLLGVSDGIFEKFVRVFDTKEEWLKGRYNYYVLKHVPDKINNWLQMKVNKMKFEHWCGWEVFSVFLSLRPSVSITFMIGFDGCYEVSYSVFPNTKSIIENPFSGDKADSFSKFMKETSLNLYIEVKGEQ